MKIYFASKNTGKMLSLARDLLGMDVEIIQTPLDIPESRSSDVQKVARKKVAIAYEMMREPILAQDSGFFIDFLGGFPGAYVNYVLETIGIEGLLTLTRDKSKECEFRECLAYLDETLSEPVSFTASVRGTLSDEPRGIVQKHHWSPLSLVFIPQGLRNTLAEMSYEEYLEWHQEARTNSASNQFARWLKKISEGEKNGI